MIADILRSRPKYEAFISSYDPAKVFPYCVVQSDSLGTSLFILTDYWGNL